MSLDRSADTRAAWQTSLPMGLSVLPLGLAFGALVTRSGLPWWWAPIIAAVVCAGSLEFLLIGLIATGTPLIHIASTAFLVNVRHVFYAASFPLHRVNGVVARLYSTFALTDEAYALTAHSEAQRWSRRRIILIQMFFHASWVCSVLVGSFVSRWLSANVGGLDFAVTALFVVLTLDAVRAHGVRVAAILAIVCAVVSSIVVSAGSLLIAAMTMFVAALMISYLAMKHLRRRRA